MADAIGAISAGGGGDVIQMFEQAEAEPEGAARGHGDGLRRLAVRPRRLAGAGLPRAAGEPGAEPLPQRARGLARRRRRGSRAAARCEGEQAVPAYVQALLEQTAEGLENLQRTLARAPRKAAARPPRSPSARPSGSACSPSRCAASSMLLARMAENSRSLQPVLIAPRRPARARRLRRSTTQSRHAPAQSRPARGRLVEEAAAGRRHTVSELRSEIRLLARTIAALAESGQ